MKVVGGPGSVDLAKKISKLLGAPLISTRTKRFPDGEFYFKFEEEISGEDLLVVQSLYPPQDQHIMELFLILHTARDLGAKSIRIFVPYLAYSRQDRRYLEGECLSSGMITEILETLGANALYTIDVHNRKVLERYRIPTYNLTASRELARYFAAKGLKNPIVISPDDEEIAIERAKCAAETINADYDFLEKKRDRITGEIVTYEKRMNVKGRDAIIIDDIISTGKTAANAVRILKKQGARRVFVGASHALLLGDAVKILNEAHAEEIVGTDSVMNDYAKVSVAPIIVKALKRETKEYHGEN
ncbi:ribose-phosphate diphosphokinase [Candidatus Bathyarchaeota archaeon]|nr:ribose-phosphate diphosphokinase [Candidatus Bathyarchaeota archaeon]